MGRVKPKVSVIMPVYNAEKTLTESVESVLAQTLENIELVIVDDGSDDSSIDILKSFSDKRIKLFHQENKGASAARNLGIKNSSADVITFLDADDLWHKDRLKHDYEIFVNSGFEQKVLLSDFYMINSLNEIVHLPKQRDFNGLLRDVEFFHPFFFNPGASMMNKSVIEKIGYFKEDTHHHEDYDFALRLIDEFPFIYSTEKLFYYRYDMDSKSKRSFDDYDYEKSHSFILDKFFEATQNAYSEEFVKRAKEQCIQTEIFALLSLKDNLNEAKALYDKSLQNKKAYACSAKGFVVMLSFVFGINFVLGVRLIIQNLYRFYFRHIRRISIQQS